MTKETDKDTDWSDIEVNKIIPGMNMKPLISIASGAMRFNKMVYDDLKKHLKSRVVVGYSKSNNSIVCEFTDIHKGLTLSISNAKSKVVICGNLLKTYGLDLDEIRGHYKYEMVDIPNVGKRLVINLNNKEVP